MPGLAASDDRIVGQDVARLSAIDHLLDAEAHGLGRVGFAAAASPEIAAVKKYFISNMPARRRTYLFEVTRQTVDSCISIASATV